MAKKERQKGKETEREKGGRKHEFFNLNIKKKTKY